MRRLFVLAVAVSIALGSLSSTAFAGGDRGHQPRYNPVIFVHGGAGSGAQFESQKMRFTSNGYPSGYVRVVDYDSLFSVNTRDDVYAKIDALVAELQAQTGKAKVDILGHSLGTSIMHDYLSTPARAANVGHYVNIDGRTAATPPGGVGTLAIWAGRGTPGRAIGGAVNVTVPNQTHVESATSRESFREMFKFFTGHEPATVDIVPEHGRVRIAGRAVLFPSNVSAGVGTVEVWPVHGSTGRRIGRRPLEVEQLAADGGCGSGVVEAGPALRVQPGQGGSPRLTASTTSRSCGATISCASWRVRRERVSTCSWRRATGTRASS